MNGNRFCYQSGEKIKKGDHVLHHGEPGEIEFVAESIAGNPEFDWYVQEHGGGIMIIGRFGHVFVMDPHADEDLEFVSRGEG